MKVSGCIIRQIIDHTEKHFHAIYKGKLIYISTEFML